MLRTSRRIWWRRRLGVVSCALASGPILAITAYIVIATSRPLSTADLPDIPELLSVLAVTAAVAVPAFVMYALIIYLLCRIRRATMVSAIASAALTYYGLAVLAGALMGVSIRGDDWIELMAALPGGAALGIIYWVLAGREEVRAESIRRQDASAIVAMD